MSFYIILLRYSRISFISFSNRLYNNLKDSFLLILRLITKLYQLYSSIIYTLLLANILVKSFKYLGILSIEYLFFFSRIFYNIII